MKVCVDAFELIKLLKQAAMVNQKNLVSIVFEEPGEVEVHLVKKPKEKKDNK